MVKMSSLEQGEDYAQRKVSILLIIHAVQGRASHQLMPEPWGVQVWLLLYRLRDWSADIGVTNIGGGESGGRQDDPEAAEDQHWSKKENTEQPRGFGDWESEIGTSSDDQDRRRVHCDSGLWHKTTDHHNKPTSNKETSI